MSYRGTPIERARRGRGAVLTTLAFLCAAGSAAQAAPQATSSDREDEPARVERGRDPSRLLEVRPEEAGSAALIQGDAKVYAEARRLLSRGQPEAALRALTRASSELLADREALVRGDALLALGDAAKAKAAYLDALERSQLKSVSVAAGRGMVNVLALLKDREGQLTYLDALLEDPQNPRRPALLLQRAGLLRDLKRGAEAGEVAFRIVRDFPASPVAPQAADFLKELQKAGVKVPVSTARIELVRIRKLIAAGEYARATAELAKLEKAQPKLRKAIELVRADVHRRRRAKDEEYASLHKLYTEGDLDPDEESEVLKRLGKIALGKDDGEGAQRFFDELESKYPNDPDAAEGQYLAAWIPYNKGDYERATEKMLAFANGHRRSALRPEALWFAGWSAYLGKRDGLARRAFEQLMEEHPTSELRAQARYWIGRMRQRNGEVDLAKASYREVLAITPLGYWGFWAMSRLEALGEKTVLEPPPPTRPASIDEVIALLGPKRPLNVDRAIALHAVDLKDEALDELQWANAHLKSVRDVAGRTMVADLLEHLGAHYLAFRVGSSIAQEGTALVAGRTHAWRAWRHAYPRAFEDETTVASKAHDIDMDLVLSIMRTESSFNTKARSPVGAYGLMQLMPTTAQQIGRSAKDGRAHAARYRAPASNVWLGAWYLSKLLVRYNGQLAQAIGAYNAGPAAMDRWVAANADQELDEFIERVPYRETRRYIRRVLETYMVYRRLNGVPLITLGGKVPSLAAPEGAVAF